MKEITLKTASQDAKIKIGKGVLKENLPRLLAGQKNFVITDFNVLEIYGDIFTEYFQAAGFYALPAGEEYKSFRSLQDVLTKMTGAGLHRTSKVLAIGGGVVGDLAGLAASLYMRGLPLVQIPTTLLSQVDSSVGGKTAVNLEGIKNVVGAFYQPSEVLIDPTFLTTLPKRELKCGLGEIVKYAALDKDIFELLKSNTDKFSDTEFLSSLIAPCVQYKADVVTRDEKETGERKCLNVGHTTGHAVELSLSLSHGESVLYGMFFETKIAMDVGVCENNYGKELLNIILAAIKTPPQTTPRFADIEKLVSLARADKKNGDDGKIVLSVAKAKGEWTTLSLSETEYETALKNAVKDI